MSDIALPEDPPIFLRIFEERVRTGRRWAPPDERPNDAQVLVFDTETFVDAKQELRFGIAREFALGHLCRTIVFVGRTTPEEAGVIERWAKAHDAVVLPVARFALEVFLPLARDMRANVVGFNLPFDLARLAADWAPKVRVGGRDSWTLWLVPRSDPNSAHIPRIGIRRLDSTKGFIRFNGTKGRPSGYAGAFVDLRTFVHVLTGEKHTLESAGTSFGCSLKKTKAEFRGPITERLLDYALNDVALTAELYGKCLDRYRSFGLHEHPSRLYSPASLAKAVLRERGIVLPKLRPRDTGRAMAGFYAGKVECRVVGKEVQDVGVLDFTAQFPSLHCLLSADHFVTARRIRTRDATREIRAWIDSLALADLLSKETWADPRMWTLCEVEPNGEILPVRSTYTGGPGQPPTIGWNHVFTEAGKTLPYFVPDLIAAKLYSGRTPNIIRATTFVPIGRQEVHPLSLLEVEIGSGDDTVRALSEARILEKVERKPGWEGRAQGLKIIANSLAYGISVEVNRKKRAGTSTIYGLGETSFEFEDTETEEPGENHSPLLGAVLTSGSHLLLALAEKVAEREGGVVVYCDTDSIFVTPSRVAPRIAEALAGLNPYSGTVPFLKDETEKKAPRKEYPSGSPDTSPRFFGLSCKRYCLFVRDRHGHPHVFRKGEEKGASDHGLGSFDIPGDRRDFVAHIWEAIIELGTEAGSRFVGIAATSPFALSTPALLPRVRDLGELRPFTFLTARLLNPSADPDDSRSELGPYISTEEVEARIRLLDAPGQRTWGSVVESFARHRDRKCEVGPNGRIVRRRVLVRASRTSGLGKEANRIADARVLGVGPTGARAKVYVPWIERILALPLEWGPKNGVPRASFARLRKALRTGRIPRGHGSRALAKARRALESETVIVEASR